MDYVFHLHFYLVQVNFFILISLSIIGKTEVTIYNNSIFYKSVYGSLLLSSLIIVFLEHKWWFAIIYTFGSMILQSVFANLINGILLPQNRLVLVKTNYVSSLYILFVYLASFFLLLASVYIIIF